MAEPWFALSPTDQAKALEVAAGRGGRPAQLFEKDIRAFVPDVLRENDPIPSSASQEKRISSAVRARLSDSIEQTVQPLFRESSKGTGARATGAPNKILPVRCDMAPLIAGVEFPTGQPLAMSAERTFSEKATAAHVYPLQGRLLGARYSLHWYDLAALAPSAFFEEFEDGFLSVHQPDFTELIASCCTIQDRLCRNSLRR